MSNRKQTPGDIKRIQNENKNNIIKNNKEYDNAAKYLTTSIKNEISGVYKKTIIDSFVEIFAENYGDSFDYNTLVNSLKFNIGIMNNSIVPNFKFTPNNVQFKSDAKNECKKFNENSINDFISNDDLISGNLNVYYFDNNEEYESYNSGNIYYNDLNIFDGQYIPVSNNERYGEFNRINKTLGYSTIEDSANKATEISLKLWDKIKNNVIDTVFKKFNL